MRGFAEANRGAYSQGQSRTRSMRVWGRATASLAWTIGGVVANNFSKMACVTEFNAHNTVESLAFVLRLAR